ncbi:MAG: extracellular solute-binding protein [Ruminococcaceae bacterium]|nr:extracellular solute-binding protein [Oscillospiraceae bacterium]
MYKTYLKRGIAALIVLLIAIQCFAVCVFAENEVGVSKTEYTQYVSIAEEESATFSLTAESDGDYNLAVVYRAVEGRVVNPEADIVITNGTDSFTQHIEFSRIWSDIRDGERFKTDSYDNEVVPEMREHFDWQTVIFGISSKTGNQAVSLKAGEYTLNITMSCEAVEIAKVYFYQSNLKSYEEYLKENSANNEKATEAVTIQAELTSFKSDSSLIPTYDRSSPSIVPNYHDRISLNIIGGSSFSEAGQWLEWQFDVEQDGYYALDVRYEQDALRGIGVGRRIYIDGEVPFAQFDNVLFPYASDYIDFRIEDKNGEAYKLYLTKGAHTLRMQVNDAHLEQEIIEIQEYIGQCNSMYRQIISITGANPDVYRDYYLDKELPSLIPFLKDSIVKLEDIAKRIERWSQDDEGSETSVIYDMVRVLKEYVEKPHKIPANLSNFKNGIDSLANMIITLQSQSITLDYITFNPVSKPLIQNDSGFFEYLWFRLKSFFNSFVEDYSIASENGGDGGQIDVWVNMGDIMVSGAATGRDQMQIIKRMCDDTFTEQYQTYVKLSLVSAGDTLTQAILADKGPDVALFVGEANIANLAIRGVLADIGKIEDFDRIKGQYDDSAYIPYTFDGSLYAMPLTQNFNMLFCRTDVFEELNLKIPDTWEEFYAVQKVLIQHNLEIGISESQDIFEMFLMQHGGSIYNADLTKSQLKEQTAVDAFTQWTDLYVKHGLPLVFNFFNRFRTGEMPMGIMSYTMYNQLSVAAPEIESQWQMYPIPGFADENGNINRIQSSSGNATIIISTSDNLKASYNFVKWWADSEIQTSFGRQVEMILGKSARYNTANLVAFENLNWTANERKNLSLAWESVSDIPQTAASYYLGRCISNAFRRVAYSYEDPRDVLYRYSDDIDNELERKRNVMKKGKE